MKQKPPQIPMAGVKELAERIAKEMDAEYPRQDWTKALWDADFATRLIAAYTDGQEPVAWDGSEGWEQLAWNLCAEEGGEESCTELLWDGGPIPEPWGDRWLKYEGEAKRMISLVRKFTAPPAPRPSYTGTCANLHETVQVPNAACAAPSSEEVGQLHPDMARSAAKSALGYAGSFNDKGIDWHNDKPWPHRMELAQALDWITELGAMVLNLADRVTPAAPSSEEVREMLARLNAVGNTSLEYAAADMIERLAARVPDGCVVVPKEPTEAMILAGNLMQHGVRAAYKAMIAVYKGPSHE